MFEIEIDDKTVKVMQLEDWKTSIENDFKPGDYFDEGISWDLINCVPPLNFGYGYFQCGEPHSFVNGKQTYLTLVRVSKEPEVWQFVGYERDDPKQILDLTKTELESFKTLNEVRKEKGLKPIEADWADKCPANPQFVQMYQSAQMDGGGMEDPDAAEDEGEEGADFGGEENGEDFGEENADENENVDNDAKAKFEQLVKSLNGETPEYISADNTPRLGTINIKLKDYSSERIEKALRTMAMSLSVPLKAAKGEVFFYKAQEDLTDKWCMFFSELVRNTYDYVTDYLDLPKKTVMSKSDILTHKGRILYNPSTGEPIKQSDWNKFVGNLEKFLNRNIKDVEKKIILESKSLAKILDRMLKYNSLDAVKNLRLNDVSYHGKSFDWISESTGNMKNVFGESLTRQEMARIEVLRQSAAQKVTNVSDKMRGDIKQILIDGVSGKKGKGQVSQALFDKMVGNNRDFQRIADTEIQNAFNNSYVQEEVYNTEEGKKTYFKRIEVIDGNTCPKCKAINGKIAVWSDKPLNDEKSKDKNADYVIWEGKDGFEWECPISVKHPYCRGTWQRYDIGLDNINIDALVAEQSKNAKKWNNAVKAAKEEYKEKGIENPDDSTKGFTERIKELYNGADSVEKSLTFSGHKLQGRTAFRGLNISIENKKGTIRRGVDSDGHKWAIKMHYDYGYIRGTEGVDGDHVDCYIGDNIDAKNVYIIHQKIPGTDKYDEDKCMLGFDTLADAKAAYLKQYDKPGFFGGVDTVPFELFKQKVLMKKYHGKKLVLN